MKSDEMLGRTVADQYTVGVSADGMVCVNIPASRLGDAVENEAFTLTLTPVQLRA